MGDDSWSHSSLLLLSRPTDAVSNGDDDYNDNDLGPGLI